jgi:hypothetical protein
VIDRFPLPVHGYICDTLPITIDRSHKSIGDTDKEKQKGNIRSRQPLQRFLKLDPRFFICVGELLLSFFFDLLSGSTKATCFHLNFIYCDTSVDFMT